MGIIILEEDSFALQVGIEHSSILDISIFLLGSEIPISLVSFHENVLDIGGDDAISRFASRCRIMNEIVYDFAIEGISKKNGILRDVIYFVAFKCQIGMGVLAERIIIRRYLFDFRASYFIPSGDSDIGDLFDMAIANEEIVASSFAILAP